MILYLENHMACYSKVVTATFADVQELVTEPETEQLVKQLDEAEVSAFMYLWFASFSPISLYWLKKKMWVQSKNIVFTGVWEMFHWICIAATKGKALSLSLYFYIYM